MSVEHTLADDQLHVQPGSGAAGRFWHFGQAMMAGPRLMHLSPLGTLGTLFPLGFLPQ